MFYVILKINCFYANYLIFFHKPRDAKYLVFWTIFYAMNFENSLLSDCLFVLPSLKPCQQFSATMHISNNADANKFIDWPVIIVINFFLQVSKLPL